MTKKRPVNLQLTTIKFPIMAIISILHRISGVILLLFIPFFLWLLQASLASVDSFTQLQSCLSHPVLKLIIWVMVSAVLYHLVAGVRHLLMDAGIGETKCGGRLGAKIVLIIAAVLIVIAGVAIW